MRDKPYKEVWGKAMAQAHDEIVGEEMRREDEQASLEIENMAEQISEAYNRAAIFARGNDLIAEILATAIDNAGEKSKYPALTLMRKIKEAGGWGYIKEMVFWSSGDARYNAKYRLPNGRISSEWWDNINELMQILGVSPSQLSYYSVMTNYFV